MPKIGNARQVWWRIVIGLVLGGVYGYGLFVVGFVGLAAGLNTFFLILATSPLGIGAWLWPVVGVLLGMSRTQWAGWTAFGIVLGHELSVSATFLVDPKLLGQFIELARVFAWEAPLALLFYFGGQVAVWLIFFLQRRSCRT